MKKSQLLIAAVLAASTMASASAQTVINITGATAFREAAHLGIKASISNCVYGYQSTNFSNAARAIFKGDILVGGVKTDVIVRTSWSGSVAGIRAVTTQSANYTVSYYDSSNATLTASLGANGTASLDVTAVASTNQNKICFADNLQSNTPFKTPTLSGGSVGVQAFAPVINESTALTANSSITTHQLRSLIKAGSIQARYLTGNVSADTGKVIFWTGRNSLSGTRAIYLAETGVGVSNPVVQFRAQTGTAGSTVSTVTDASTAISALRYWPTEANNNGVDVWDAAAQTGNATVGNGGYDSGGLLGNIMQRAFTANVSIEDDSGAEYLNYSSSNIALCSVVSVQELPVITAGGGKVLAYNGYLLYPSTFLANGAGGLTQADKDKIIHGQYTLWSYEQLLYRSGLSTTETALISLLNTNVPANIGGNGVPLSQMLVTRATDGGDISVSASLP